jgi:hypothetical protein
MALAVAGCWMLLEGGELRFQSREMVERFLVRAMQPLCSMVTVVAVKCSVQLWSHNWPMDTSDPQAKHGKMWA